MFLFCFVLFGLQLSVCLCWRLVPLRGLSDVLLKRRNGAVMVLQLRDAVHAGAVTIALNSTTCVIEWADGSRTVCAGAARARAIKMN